MMRSRLARKLREAQARGPGAYGWKAALAALLSVIAAVGALLRGPHPYGAAEVPQILIDGQTRPEGCLRCHQGARGLGSSHDPSAIGCSTCHLGDPTALDEAGAHRGMTVLAGDLRIAAATCGLASCHPSEVARVKGSLMAGSPGLLAVNRYVFGERESPAGSWQQDDLRTLDSHAAPASPAESHVRKLCGSCHLGAAKDKPGDQGFESRGGGCAACHLAPPAGSSGGAGLLHPDVSAAVSEARCEGCHSRSARIALSFHGKAEREEGNSEARERLPDGRPFSRTDADVHASKGMTCIDCHVEREVMGDGRPHLHGDEATQVRCEDCHAAVGATAIPADAARVAGVLRDSWIKRGMPAVGSAPLTTNQGTPLWRTDSSTGTQRLVRDGTSVRIPPASAAAWHRMRGHERLSCQACHTAWAPRCPTCHTRFDPSGEQYDHVTGRETPGEWIEEPAPFGIGRPLLALRSDGRAGPFVEGMRLTISGIPNELSGTFWAPIDAHTTGKSRPCESCHGRKAAEYYPTEGKTTRVRARLFDRQSLERIMAVGECIECHQRYEDPIWADFEASVSRLRTARGRCQAKVIPDLPERSGE